MKNIFIDKKLGTGWSIVPLRVLVPDESLYSVVFIQPRGSLTANDAGVKNSIGKTAQAKYKAFLTLAGDGDTKSAGLNADLVVTPEYSCPWSIVQQAVISIKSSAPLLPNEGALWILGCESITPRELDELAASAPEAVWIYEKLMPHATATYLDPLCYLFWALDEQQQSRLVVLVQFKGQAMSDHSKYLERDKLIKGTERYVLRNDDQSVYLTALICSDALDFKMESLPQSYNVSYIIVHPQLNTGPRHPAFAVYRKEAYQQQYSERFELLCVNWSKGFSFSGLGTSDFGGSAFYTKSKDLRLDDKMIEANHSKGLYYTLCESHHASIYFFNYAEHVFYFQTTKPSQAAAKSALAKRTGPQMIDTYLWAGSKWQKNHRVNDGFHELCREIRSDVHPLLERALSSVDRERLLVLASAEVGMTKTGRQAKEWDRTKDWSLPKNLVSLRVTDDEIVNRITVAQDPCKQAQARKSKYLINYTILKNQILTDERNFPEPIADLARDNVIRYPLGKDKYHHNLCRSDGQRIATVAYVGECTPRQARQLYDDTISSLRSNVRRRLVVWFRYQERFKRYYWKGGKPKVNDIFETPKDIRSVL